MKPSGLLFVPCVLCLLAGQGCATWPKRVPSSLRNNQNIDAFVTPGTDSAGMIWFIQPVWPAPPPELPPDDGVRRSLDRCGGPAGALFHEWKNVAPPTLRLVHGYAAGSEFSGEDFWGTHRYKDWNIILVVNNGYNPFLAPANFLSEGSGWKEDPLVQRLVAKNSNLNGLLELEWDSGYFAPRMAPLAGDETLAVGRWDFDCGHESAGADPDAMPIGFRAEIHAPEILASGHIVKRDATTLQAQFKIFAGSRSGPLEATPFILFLIERFFSSYKNPLGGKDYSISLRPPAGGWKIASCRRKDGDPAGGRANRIKGFQIIPLTKGYELCIMVLHGCKRYFRLGLRVSEFFTIL